MSNQPPSAQRKWTEIEPAEAVKLSHEDSKLDLWRRRPHFRMPSIETAMVTGACEHEWEYLEREPGETYTGYCERCVKCGQIIQVVQ